MAADALVPEIKTHGVFEEQPSSLWGFSRDLGLGTEPVARDYEAERRPLLERREQNIDTQRRTIADAQTETERQSRGLESDAARMHGERAAARPAPLTMASAPSAEARPFLMPSGDIISRFQTLLLAAGSVGVQIGGLKGSAFGAVSAMKGLAEGWAAGDAERVKREYAAWKAESGRLIELHADALRTYKDLVEDQKLSVEQKRVAGTLRLKGYDWQAAMHAVEGADIEAQLKELTAAETRHDALVEKAREFDEKMDEQRRFHDIWADIQRDNRKERAREADQRLDLAVRKFKQTAATAGAGEFTPDALEMYANVVADGGQPPALGWGKAATEARIKIANRAADIRKARGDTAGSLLLAQTSQKSNQAELTRIQSQRGPMLAFAATAEKNLDLAVKLSETVEREQWPVVNRWLLAGELKWQGDPRVAAFATATRTAINETAKVTNSATGSGVSTNAARHEIEEMLATAYTPEQFRSVASVLRTDMRNRIKGYDEQIASVKAAVSGGGAATIRVRRKSDGQTGDLDPKKWDPDKYERL